MPYLQAYAHNRGIDMEMSDMWLGNADEKTLSLEVRLPELERCRKESAGLSCVLLIGDKFGPRPAPARIQQADLEGLLPLMSHVGSALVSEWYVLDENRLDSEKRVCARTRGRILVSHGGRCASTDRSTACTRGELLNTASKFRLSIMTKHGVAPRWA